MKPYYLLLIAVASIFFVSCGENPEDIYGEWKVEHLTIRCPDRQSFSRYLQSFEEDLEGANFTFFNSGRREDFGRFKYENHGRKCTGEWFFRSDSVIIQDCKITDVRNDEYEIMHLSGNEMILTRNVMMYDRNVYTSMTLKRIKEGEDDE